MTDSNYTLLVLIVDRSGSMSFMKNEAEVMLNDLVKEQAAQPGVCDIKLCTFDHHVTLPDMYLATQADPIIITPRGGTALYDAIGSTIENVGATLSRWSEARRPGHVIVATVTDGGENQSQTYSASRVRELIEHQRAVYRWDFTFLGANQDAVLNAAKIGIPQASSMTYSTAAVGAAGQSLTHYVTTTRSGVAASYSNEDRIAATGGE